MPGKEAPFLFSYRSLVTVLCFWSVTNMMYLRLHLSLAIICMTNSSRPDRTGNVTDNDDYTTNTSRQINISEYSPSRETGRRLHWDAATQGQVLSAFNFGYASSKLPASWLVGRVGGRWVVLVGSLLSSLACLVTPMVSLHSVVAVIVLRVAMGICAGTLSPALQVILGHWAPPWERSRMGSLTFAGFPCGTLVAFTLTGFLCEHGLYGGWPSVFYTFGGLGVAFCLIWILFVAESPTSQACIGRQEKEYILRSLNRTTNSENARPSIPWRSILTSPAVYAVVACAVGMDFVGNIFLVYLPTYLSDVMDFNIASSGLLSALPYLFCMLALTLAGCLSDCLIKRGLLRTGTARKLVTGSGMLMDIVSLVIISFISSDQPEVAVLLLVINVSGIGLITIGYFVNPLDIAPQYASVVVSIACTAGDISGFISPAFVAVLMGQVSSRESWRLVFLVSAAIMAACLLFYLIFASGEVQPWAYPSQDSSISPEGRLNQEQNGETAPLSNHSTPVSPPTPAPDLSDRFHTRTSDSGKSKLLTIPKTSVSVPPHTH